MRTRLAVLLSSAVIALAACRDSTGPPVVSLSIIGGNDQAGLPGDTLPQPFRVLLTAPDGTPRPGITVRWTATGGTGVTGPETTSDSAGIATTRVVLGLEPGDVAVTAAVLSGADTATSTFSARVKDPCGHVRPLGLDTSVTETIAEKDCRFHDGSHVDIWLLTLAAPARVTITMASGAVDAYLALEDTVQPRAYNNDAGGSDAAIAALLPAGSYFVLANTLLGRQFGAYTLRAAAGPADIGECEEVWVVPPAALAQTLPLRSCRGVGGDSAAVVADQVPVYVMPGPLAVEMTSPAWPARVRVYADGAVVAEGAAAAAGDTARAVFTVPPGARGKVFVQFGARDGGGAGGAYVMRVF